jgi:hypothetical protein
MKIPYVNKTEDGSIMIEFVKEDRRFNICLEKNLKESSWNYIQKGKHLSAISNPLPTDMMNYLKVFFGDDDEGEITP